MSDHWLSEAARLQAEVDSLRGEVARLTDKCDRQAMILRRFSPDRFPNTYFIHAGVGEKDQNGMPEKLLVVPAYGVDFSYVYEYTGRLTGAQW